MADSVRVVSAQYSDFLEGDAVCASAAAARYAVVGSFISSDVELDFIRLPVFAPGIYERKASSVIVRYLSPFFDYDIPQRDSLVVRGSALVRNSSTFSGNVEEAYHRVP